MKILSIYRGKIGENRGTPIRIKTLLSYLAKEKDIELSYCSWDERADIPAKHFMLTNNHFDDIKKIVRYAKENNIDIIIGHTMSAGYYLGPLKFLTRAKIVLEMHGFIEEEAYLYGGIGNARRLATKFLYGLFYPFCDLITTCSDTATEILSAYNKNTFSIFCGVDPEIFNPKIQPSHHIRKDGRIIIGYIGNARIWQGTDFLIDTYKELKQKDSRFRLVMALSEKKARRDDTVEYVGPLLHEEIPAFIAECDILVIPRPQNTVNRISFPSKLPEYMAMGKPVIASKTSDAHKFITDGADGLLYEPEDKKGLENAILKLSDGALREKIGINASLTIHKWYEYDRQSGRMVQLLKMLYNGDKFMLSKNKE